MNRAKSGRKKQLHQKVGCKTRAFVDDSIVHWQAAMLALQRWNNIGPHLTWLAETRLLLRLPSWNKRFILRRAALKALADRIGMSRIADLYLALIRSMPYYSASADS